MSSVQLVRLTDAQVEGLELIVAGLLPGTRGYGLPREEGPEPSLIVSADEPLVPGSVVHLCDRQNTPLVALAVDRVADAPGGGVCIAGEVHGLRRFEHGPARELRLSGEEDFAHAVVALFSRVVYPADVLRAIAQAGTSPLVLAAQGSLSRKESAALVATVVEAGQLIPGSQVYYIPRAADFEPIGDVSATVLEGLGAQRVLDFRRLERETSLGAVVLFTGLSGSGKSTVAAAVADKLAEVSLRNVVLLDGDHVRAELSSELGFSAEDRRTNLLRQAWVGARVAEAGGIAICAPIAPLESTRQEMRRRVEPDSAFVLVHVATPLEVAEARDRKGLYAKARAGKLPDFTGIDSPYEAPSNADVEIDTSIHSVEESVKMIIDRLFERGLL